VKVFGIGLNKTGTSSLHAALELLGFRSLHWGGPPVRALVEAARDEGRPLVEDLPGYDAFSDIWALSESFALLDVQYPGSRFVLTTRDREAWVDSRRRHVERNRVAAAEGRYTGTFLEVEPEAWREQWDAHHAAVRAYFAGRDDLLVMDIPGGDGWEALAPFLGRPVPGHPFPSENRG
jgi:hypothetical protein